MRYRMMVVGIVAAALVAAGAWAASHEAGDPPNSAPASPSAASGVESRAGWDLLPAQAGPMAAPRRGPGAMEHGPGRGMRRAGPGRFEGPALEQLDLTKQQRERIADLHETAQRKAIRLRADLETAQLDLRKLMRADKPDRRAIETQIDRISGIRASLQKDRVGTMLDVRAVLTPEQLEKLESSRGRGRGAGLGPRHGWGGPDPLDEPDGEEDGESL